MEKPIVFISHSPEDDEEKNHLLQHLQILQNDAHLIELWSDAEISPGMNWEDERIKIITQAKIAILIITTHFFNNRFISDKEVPEILKSYNQGKLLIIPVIARACAWELIEWLNPLSVRPRDRRPIWNTPDKDVDNELANITKEVAQIVIEALNAEPKSETIKKFYTEENALTTITTLMEYTEEEIMFAAAALNNMVATAERLTHDLDEIASQLEQADEEQDEILIEMASVIRGTTHIIHGEWPFFTYPLSTVITRFTVSFTILSQFNIRNVDHISEVKKVFNIIRKLKLTLTEFENTLNTVLVAVTNFPDKPPILGHAKEYLITVLRISRKDFPKILDRILKLETEMENITWVNNPE